MGGADDVLNALLLLEQYGVGPGEALFVLLEVVIVELSEWHGL